MINKHDMTDFDFGFTVIDENDLKQTEQELTVKLQESEKTVESVSKAAQESIFQLRNMIIPLLNNLAQGPDEAMIKWPNRKAKIKEFRAKLDSFVETSVKNLK